MSRLATNPEAAGASSLPSVEPTEESKLKELLRNYIKSLISLVESTTALLYTPSPTSQRVVRLLKHQHSFSNSPASFLSLAGTSYKRSISRIEWCTRVMNLPNLPEYMPRFSNGNASDNIENLRIITEIVADCTVRVNQALLCGEQRP